MDNSSNNSAWGRAKLLIVALLGGLLLLTLLVYLPGQSGSLLLDDAWVLQPLAEGDGINSAAEARQFVFGNTSGPSGRPVAMLSLLLNIPDWPPDVALLKLTNILIHLACGVALFGLSRLLSLQLGLPEASAAWFALAVTALWMLHPLNVSTTLYVVQRMTQLMTLFTLISLFCFLKGRRLLADNSESAGRHGQAIGYFVACLFPFALLAVLSKENGALLLILILLIEALLFRGVAMTRLYRIWLLIGVGLPLMLVLSYLIWTFPDSVAAYDTRSFSLGERLLTEGRVLSDYLLKIIFPWLGVGFLFHDDWTVSESLLSPLITLPAVLVCLGLLFSAWVFRRQQPVYSLAVFWFFAMHILESSYLPLELAYEHRNYLAMVGPLFALAWYCRSCLGKLSMPKKQGLRTAVCGMVLVLLSWQTFGLTSLWGATVPLHAYWAEQQPNSVRAQFTYASYLENAGDIEQAMARLEQARSQMPNEITVLLNQWQFACRNGLSAPVALSEMAGNSELVHYQGDLNAHLRRLLEGFFQGQCDYPDIATMVGLFERIGDLPLNDFKRAGYHVYFSDLFVYQQQLDPALMQMSRAFELRPIPQYPLRQALICASAGRFNDALVFLERARQADNNRGPLIPSIMGEINRLETEFRARI